MMAPLSCSRLALLCFGSFAIVPARAAPVSGECGPPGSEVDGVVQGDDEMALLHGAGSHVHTSTIRKRGGHAQPEADIVTLQTAAKVDKAGSASRSADTISTSNSSDASSTLPAVPAASTVSLVREADASITELAPAAAEAMQDVIEVPNAEGFTSWLPAENSAEIAEMTEFASAEITTAKTPATKMAARNVPRVRALSDVVAADVAAAQAAAEAATVKPVLLAISSLSSRTRGALESFSYELGLHLPLTLALLAFIAAIFMMTMSTLKIWVSFFFDSPVEGPVPSERPNPLQALRVLQLNLDNIGQAKGMAAKPNTDIDAEKTPRGHDSS